MNKFKVIGYIILGLIAFYAIAYLSFGASIPLLYWQKDVEREVIERSPQYIITQRSAINKLYSEYTKVDGARKEAIKTQMCDKAIRIPEDELPSNKIKLICEI